MDNFQKKNRAAILTFFFILGSFFYFAENGQAATSNAIDKVVTTTTPNANVPSQPNTQNPEDTALINFSEKAVLAAFNYNYQDYQTQLEAASHFFTAESWNEFSSALAKSNNLSTVVANKLTVSSIISGKTKITLGTDGIWNVEVPTTVTYQDLNNQKMVQNLLVKLQVIKVPTSINPAGIAIKQFIGKPIS